MDHTDKEIVGVLRHLLAHVKDGTWVIKHANIGRSADSLDVHVRVEEPAPKKP